MSNINSPDPSNDKPKKQRKKRKTKGSDIRPENFSEKLVWYSIIWTYIFFLLGAVYVVGSVLGWLLFFVLLLKLWFQTNDTPPEKKITIPWITIVWIIGMLIEEVALVMGHLDYNLPTTLLIKSSIGWAKGWASLALYPLAGCLPIRPQLVYRATCIVCFHTLLLAPLLIMAPILHLPEVLYISPLQAVGGPGPTCFDVSLYEISYDGELRQRLFTPWGPALGFLANIYFLLSLQEKDKKWRLRGVIGALFMAYICKSRLALISAVLTPVMVYVVSRLVRPSTQLVLGVSAFIGGLLSTPIIETFTSFLDKVKSSRADSTRVRALLKDIAFVRAEKEAPIWGHGVVENGPHLVEYMPIGSHHTWAGLMFVKGIVGFWSLGIPMILSAFVLLYKSQFKKVAGAGFGVLFILFLYTFGENLEILVYLYWPGLIVMGIAFKEKINPAPAETVSHGA